MTKVYLIRVIDEEGDDNVYGVYSDLDNFVTANGWTDVSHWNYTRYEAQDTEGYSVYATPFALDDVY